MAVSDLFSNPEDTREAIMKATYDALCKHGYANLTIQRIGDEFPKSKSLVYHHYNSKDDLLLDFLDYLLEHFETSVPHEDYADAAAHLMAVIEYVLPDELDDEHREFTRAMIELRAQAAHDPAYHASFTRSTQFFHNRLEAIIERGIQEGGFRDVEPRRIAALLHATLEGARFQRVTADIEATIPLIREALYAYVETHVLSQCESME